MYAHRLAYSVAYGPIPDDRPLVLHRCHNPRCVRPDHHAVGTTADNAQDREQRRRGRTVGGAETDLRALVAVFGARAWPAIRWEAERRTDRGAA